MVALRILVYVCIILGMVVVGKVILWKRRRGRYFERCLVAEEPCLRIRCFPCGTQRASHCIFVLFVTPLVLVVALSFLLKIAGSVYWWMLFLGWMFCVEVEILAIQTFVFGLIMQIGAKGICYPLSDFNAAFLRSVDQPYFKLDSMEVATNREKTIMAPAQSVLGWKWFQFGNHLSLMLNCQGFRKPSPKEFVFRLPQLSDPERQEMMSLLDEMKVDGKMS